MPPAARKKQEKREWLVIFDPSGDFVGRAFRNFDLFPGGWDDGTLFWNVRNGRLRMWKDGRFFRFPRETKEHQ